MNTITLGQALGVLIPMGIGYAVGVRAPRQDKWQPRRHTKSHYTTTTRREQ